MPLVGRERVLLIGDADHQVESALASAIPGAEVVSVEGVFSGIHELSRSPYGTVMAAAEPIERRPEAAVKALRELIGHGRLLLFGHPTLEPLSRKMLEFGVDDYVVTPANPSELQQVFGMPLPLRLAGLDPAPAGNEPAGAAAPIAAGPRAGAVSERLATLAGLPLAEVMLEALQQAPQAALTHAARALDARLAPGARLTLLGPGAPPPQPADGQAVLSHAVWVENVEKATLHLALPRDDDPVSGRHFLAQLAHLAGRLAHLEQDYTRLHAMALTDELTGLYNSRYFKVFLAKMCQRARRERFLVTLLLFDIDNFKKYNDEYGHALGDEILRQTATLMRKCCRPHDRVFRIAGDEFAVVFWEKEPPRQPHGGGSFGPSSTAPSRVPESIAPILERFRRTIAAPEFATLGQSGKGTLSISGGLAVFPFDANSPDELVEAADRALMFGAKRSGKNSIYLVGGEDHAG